MQSISARVSDETHAEIEALAEERGSSVSQVTRDLIEKGMAYDDLKNERDRLERQLAATNQRVDEHQELVRYVREERTMERRRAEAGVFTRAKWWLTGMPADGERVDE